MLTLGELAALLLALGACAWLWHAHGVHEHALRLVREACRREDVLLLDDNVAFRRLRLRRDRNGRRRLAREYGFEFTVTGEQRLSGSISMYGRQLGAIELAAHPFQAPPPHDDKVIRLDDWRRDHPKGDEQRRVD